MLVLNSIRCLHNEVLKLLKIELSIKSKIKEINI